MNNTEIDGAARERLHQAILLELDERGEEAIRLPVVLADAAVSEADFAAHYDDVEACLFAAYEDLTSRLDSAVRGACRNAGSGSGDWVERVRAALAALVGELAREPRLARVLASGFPAIGPRAQMRFQAFVESFGPMLAGGRAVADPGEDLPGEVEMLATGAVEALIFEEITSGRAERLPAMLPELVFSLLVPFVGPSRAAAEMRATEAD